MKNSYIDELNLSIVRLSAKIEEEPEDVEDILDEAHDLMIDIINARESFTEESLDPKALRLDELYMDADSLIQRCNEACAELNETWIY